MSPKTITESTITVKTFVLVPIVIGIAAATMGWGLTWGSASKQVQECQVLAHSNQTKIIKIENMLGKFETHLEYIIKSIDEIKEQR